MTKENLSRSSLAQPVLTANLKQPPLQTDRLILRPLADQDAAAIQQILSDRAIADTMISIPYPYPSDEAEAYVARQRSAFEAGQAVTFAIVRQETVRQETVRQETVRQETVRQESEQTAQQELIGIIEIREIDREHQQAELSFWLAKNAWNQGYMSEALPPILQYVFLDLGSNRLYAYYMTRNPACGKLLRNAGFVQEGVLRQRVRKWGEFEDVVLMSILREEW